jgi:hypothetical protein
LNITPTELRGVGISVHRLEDFDAPFSREASSLKSFFKKVTPVTSETLTEYSTRRAEAAVREESNVLDHRRHRFPDGDSNGPSESSVRTPRKPNDPVVNELKRVSFNCDVLVCSSDSSGESEPEMSTTLVIQDAPQKDGPKSASCVVAYTKSSVEVPKSVEFQGNHWYLEDGCDVDVAVLKTLPADIRDEILQSLLVGGRLLPVAGLESLILSQRPAETTSTHNTTKTANCPPPAIPPSRERRESHTTARLQHLKQTSATRHEHQSGSATDTDDASDTGDHFVSKRRPRSRTGPSARLQATKKQHKVLDTSCLCPIAFALIVVTLRSANLDDSI